MIIKSLYTRMLYVFLGSVLVSLAVGFIVTNSLFRDQVTGIVQDSLISNGRSIVQAYKESDPQQRDFLLKSMASAPLYYIRIYDQTGNVISVATPGSENTLHVSEDELNQVLSGSVYRESPESGFENLKVGLPFEIGGEPYALFMKQNFSEFGRSMAGLFTTQLLIILLIGSLLIVLSVRYIVKPIQYLTTATRKMAKGDFSIHLKTKRQDEIGQLTASFNEMADELGKLEKLRRQFVSDVSHEIQSPLTSIKGFARALKSKNLNEADRMRLLTIIEEETNRLSRLSENLLQLSSLEHENIQLNVSKFRLDEQIRKVMISLEPQWSSKDLDIEIDLEEMMILADEDKLSQVWTNIVGNSIKFTERGGKIRVTGRKHVRGFEISISDSGRGIPEEELRHIFKPFYKIDKSRERSLGGNGIGLSIVKRIVDLHGADIEVKSKPGEGTAITVFFAT